MTAKKAAQGAARPNLLPVSRHTLGQPGGPQATIALVGSGSIIRDGAYTVRLDEIETDALRHNAQQAADLVHDALLYDLTSGRYCRRELRLLIHQQLALACDITSRAHFRHDRVISTPAGIVLVAMPCTDALEWPNTPWCDYATTLRVCASDDGAFSWDPGPFGEQASYHLVGRQRTAYAHELAAALDGQEMSIAAPLRDGLIRLKFSNTSCAITASAAQALRDWLLNDLETNPAQRPKRILR